ncbi:hypothetical protein ACFQ3Z_45735 [Streptomyces nogalater]
MTLPEPRKSLSGGALGELAYASLADAEFGRQLSAVQPAHTQRLVHRLVADRLKLVAEVLYTASKTMCDLRALQRVRELLQLGQGDVESRIELVSQRGWSYIVRFHTCLPS